MNVLRTDTFSLLRVFVKESDINGAGEGLFSLINEEEDCVMSFYNVIRISHEEVSINLCVIFKSNGNNKLQYSSCLELSNASIDIVR